MEIGRQKTKKIGVTAPAVSSPRAGSAWKMAQKIIIFQQKIMIFQQKMAYFQTGTTKAPTRRSWTQVSPRAQSSTVNNHIVVRHQTQSVRDAAGDAAGDRVVAGILLCGCASESVNCHPDLKSIQWMNEAVWSCMKLYAMRTTVRSFTHMTTGMYSLFE